MEGRTREGSTILVEEAREPPSEGTRSGAPRRTGARGGRGLARLALCRCRQVFFGACVVLDCTCWQAGAAGLVKQRKQRWRQQLAPSSQVLEARHARARAHSVKETRERERRAAAVAMAASQRCGDEGCFSLPGPTCYGLLEGGLVTMQVATGRVRCRWPGKRVTQKGSEGWGWMSGPRVIKAGPW